MSTRSSSRTIRLDVDTVAAVQQRLVDSDNDRDLAGGGWRDGQHVIAWEDGRPTQPAWWSHRFTRLTAALDLPRIRLHDIRHTHATHLLEAGVHPKVVAERLGHSSTNVTLDVYSHVSPRLHDEAIATVAELYRQS